jgi:LysR family glycine cleavage system transcriptional activator
MTSRIPSLNWLRVFEAAARTGSFARAAQTLNMSAPAVSQQIKALEGALGRALFDRGARSVTLTDAGKAFLPTVVRALHSVESASASLFGGRDSTPLTIQCSLLFGAGWLAPRLKQFSAANPDIRINLISAIQDEDFTAGKSDLRIVFGMPPGPFEVSDLLFGEEIYPVALPEIANSVRGPSDLLNHPLIEIATHRANWWSFLPQDGPPPNFIYTDNTMTALSLARTGAIALARSPATADLPVLHGLVPCPAFKPTRGVQSYVLIYPGEAQLSTAALRFREWLLLEAADTLD